MPPISHLPWRDAIARRLEETSAPIPVTGCMIWLGKLDRDGYGLVHVHKWTKAMAHRAAYELAAGSIDDNLVIDHLCRVRCCINPLHMEQVTRQVNTLRGEGISANRARQTTCRIGHPLSGPNLYILPNGSRACRECRRSASRRYKRKLVEAA